jgi:hypothetical protein
LAVSAHIFRQWSSIWLVNRVQISEWLGISCGNLKPLNEAVSKVQWTVG